MTEQLHFHFSLSCIGEGNDNPLQCSCLENPKDEGAWWAAVCGVGCTESDITEVSWQQQQQDSVWVFPGDSVVRNPPVNAGDAGLIPGLGRSPGGGHGNPLQYSCQENSMDSGTWWATIHRSQRVGHN